MTELLAKVGSKMVLGGFLIAALYISGAALVTPGQEFEAYKATIKSMSDSELLEGYEKAFSEMKTFKMPKVTETSISQMPFFKLNLFRTYIQEIKERKLPKNLKEAERLLNEQTKVIVDGLGAHHARMLKRNELKNR